MQVSNFRAFSSNRQVYEISMGVSQQLCAVIKKIIQPIFNFLLYTGSFPLRYVGSKTWSVPGVVLRAPIVIVRRVLGLNKGKMKAELFPQNYRFNFEKRLNREETKIYYPHVAATAFVHSCKNDFIPKGWVNCSPKKMNLSLPGIDLEEKCLFDPKTGAKISILEKDKEVIIAFGSLEADGGQGTKAKNPGKGKVAAVLQSILGISPRTLGAVDRIVPALLESGCFKDKNITFTGNSLGATLAQYAGLQFERPSVCFNAFGLDCSTQYWLGTEKLKQADKYVTHISVEGDYVTDLGVYKPLDLALSAIGMKTPGNFGRRYTIPSAYTSWFATHGFVLGSLFQHLGHDYRSYPATTDVYTGA